MTEGQKRVGVNFNPSGNRDVDDIKSATAILIDAILENGNDHRCNALAATAYEEAAMWAVKSLTKPLNEVGE